jgi:thiol-disulfide isomerase/thioredoxin
MVFLALAAAVSLVSPGCQQKTNAPSRVAVAEEPASEDATPADGTQPAAADQSAETTPQPDSPPSPEPPVSAETPDENTEPTPDEAKPSPSESEPEQGETPDNPSPAAEPKQPASDPDPSDDSDPDATDPAPADEPADEGALENPFARRIEVPDFPRDMQWLNTNGPLRKKDLKGKFVILDFWTYCCINCIHILPELKKLEKAYPNELVVIGVHSAKFETEKGTKNIEEAVLRYEIEHPVVNDADHVIWDTFGVRSWPTVMMIDPEGNAVWGTGGEIEFETVDDILKLAIPYYKQAKLLDETPIRFDLLADRQEKTPLRFPGKVLADEEGRRLFITDSNHNRIVIASLDGKLIDTIGSGAIGRQDGDFAKASFDHLQGLALHGDTLYVADTENHMLRKIDLKTKQVTTIAGTGKQRRAPWPGIDLETGTVPERFVSKPSETELNSPWALWVHKDDLYIAMAGPHQIWKMKLDETEIGPYAGNGREDIVDGPLLPPSPYEEGYSSFAQPSGLASDGEWLFVADSEGSSIRAVPFDPAEEVRTIVGTSELPGARLFTFGDRDGEGLVQVKQDEDGEPIYNRDFTMQTEGPLLQHALGVVYHEGQIYVADTYNNKIKVVDAKAGATKTIAGTGEPGLTDEPAQFDEPAGITFADGILYVADTNNHVIRTVNVSTGQVGQFVVEGLAPPNPPAVARKPNFSKAKQIEVAATKVKPQEGAIKLNVHLQLPAGWKINKLAPASYWLEAAGDAGAIDRESLGRKKLEEPATEFEVSVPVKGVGEDELQLAMNYYYCQEGDVGLCKVGSVVWNISLVIDEESSTTSIDLEHQVSN